MCTDSRKFVRTKFKTYFQSSCWAQKAMLDALCTGEISQHLHQYQSSLQTPSLRCVI